MMKFLKDDEHMKMRKVFVEAYHKKETVEVDELWQTRVMSHIRGLGPLYPVTSYLQLFEGFVWRLAPVACVLILVLAAILIHMDFISEYEMARILFEDPLDSSLIPFTTVS